MALTCMTCLMQQEVEAIVDHDTILMCIHEHKQTDKLLAVTVDTGECCACAATISNVAHP